MSTAERITRAEAEAVLADVKNRYRAYLDAGYDEPKLIMDYDYFDRGEGVPAIVWDGPDEWAYRYVMGGVDEELCGFAADVIGRDAVREQVREGRFTEEPATRPEGVGLECITFWAISLYRES